jgi:hypothetical protein
MAVNVESESINQLNNSRNFTIQDESADVACFFALIM